MPETAIAREIYLKSDKGEINVFLCPDPSNDSQINSSPTDPLLQDIKPLLTPVYDSPRHKNGKFLISIKFFFIFLKIRIFFYLALIRPLGSAQRNLNKTLLAASPIKLPPPSSDKQHIYQTPTKPILTINEMNLLEANNICSRNNNINANKNLNSTRKFVTTNLKNDSCDDDDGSDKDDGDDLLLKNDVKFVNQTFLTQSPNDNGRKGVRNALFSESCGLSPMHIPPVDNNGEIYFFLVFAFHFCFIYIQTSVGIAQRGL